MPRLISVVSAPPENIVPQAVATALARETFGPLVPHLERLMSVFENTGIETRRMCKDLDWYRQEHSLAESSAAYIEIATDLCAKAGGSVGSVRVARHSAEGWRCNAGRGDDA